MEPLKTTLAIGAFGPLVTRFVPGGYRPEVASESPADRVHRAMDALGDVVDGYELYHPYGIDEDSLDSVRAALGDHDLYAVAIALHPDPRFGRGGLTSPVEAVRTEALRRTISGIEIASQFGARVIIWPGVEGYNYPFQASYRESWARLVDGIGLAASRCRELDVQLLLEPKTSEPAMKLHLRDPLAALHLIAKLRDAGMDNVKINLDWQNVILAGESLAEMAALLWEEGLLGHLHASSGWAVNDDKNIVGTSHFMETLELAIVLQDIGYGDAGGRIGIDLYPYTEDPSAAVRQSARNWRYLEKIAAAVDRKSLHEAQATKDAVAAYEVVYQALGA